MNAVKKTVKTAGFMIIATLLAKLMGMYRDVLFAALYGTSEAAIAYQTASRIPLLFFDIALGSAISSSFIPVFNEYLSRGEKEKATEFSNSFLNIIFILTALICAVGMLFNGPIVNLLANGLAPHVKILSAQLVSIMFPSMIFTATAYSLTGVLQSYGEFNAPAAISLVSNSIMVVYLLVIKDNLGIFGLAVAMLVAWAFQILVLIPSLVKKKYAYSPKINFKNEGLLKALKLAIPVLISSWVQPINTMVNMFLASFLNGGQAVSALDYANKLYIIFVGVITFAVSNLIFPSISKLAAQEDKGEEFNDVLRSAISSVLFILTPVMIIFVLKRVEIVRFVYERGAFGKEQTNLTSLALLWYSFGMIGYGLQEILNKAFYAKQNGKVPMRVSVVGIVLNITLSFVFVRVLNTGMAGLPAAASIASVFMSLVLSIIAGKRHRIFDKTLILNIMKIAISALAMAIVMIFLKNLDFSNDFFGNFINLLITSIAGVVAYILISFFTRTNETEIIINLIKKRSEESE